LQLILKIYFKILPQSTTIFSQFIASFFNKNNTVSEISSAFINLFIIGSSALIFLNFASAHFQIGVSTEPGLTVFTKIFQLKFLAHIFENISTTTFEHKYSGFLVHQATGNGFTQKILQIFIIFHKSQVYCFSNNSVA
jgi:hypothetical protein